MLKRNLSLLFATTIASASFAVSAKADTTNARCEYYPNGQSKATVSMSCKFSQRQGNISIEWADGVRNEFTPTGSNPGNYVDQRGGAVYRQSGLGDKGQIFKLPSGLVYVYWSTAPTTTQPTAPRGISTLKASSANAQINVRSQPTVNSSSPSYGVPGDKVSVLECVPDKDTSGSDLNWCKVQFVQSKSIGWVRSDFILFAE